MRRLAAVALVLAGAGCWYHRVDVPSPVTHATNAQESSTEWAFFWHAKEIPPGTLCVSGGLKEVVVRSNWVFSLISVATLGIVSAARVERHCARAIIVDSATPANPAPTGPPGGATYLSLVYGAYQGEKAPSCNERPLARVEVKANPLFDLVSVVTVGLVSPARIRWACVEKPGSTP